jgi:hypothetical protein
MTQLRGAGVSVPTEFIVVEKLVVPAVLGKPWIDQNVLSISPRRGTLRVQFRENMEPVEIMLKKRTINSVVVVRAASICVVPALSEAWITVSANRKGLSVMSPTRYRDRLVQVKNALIDIPELGQPFRVLVANFGDQPLNVPKGQVLGLAEAAQSFPVCAVTAAEQKEEEVDWTEQIFQTISHLTDEQKSQQFDTLRPHASTWDGHLGYISAVQHHIQTTGPRVASQPYRTGPASREVIYAEIKRMLSMDIIEPSSGPWSAPIVLIPKPDGSVRFCIDYKRLNIVTENDSFTLPRIDDCLDSLGSSRYFLTLDANSGYWQINVPSRGFGQDGFYFSPGTVSI